YCTPGLLLDMWPSIDQPSCLFEQERGGFSVGRRNAEWRRSSPRVDLVGALTALMLCLGTLDASTANSYASGPSDPFGPATTDSDPASLNATHNSAVLVAYRGVSSHAPWYWQVSEAAVKREIAEAAA